MGAIGVTVSDVDRAVDFYSQLSFRKISEVEVLGPEYEHLEGVFGARMRIVRMQLGEEFIDLTQYLAPPGQPIPADSRSNDRWFQHIAIVVRDMDKAFEKVRAMKVQFVSTAPQTLPPSITAAAGIKAFYFHDPDGHNLELIYFPSGKGDPRWQQPNEKLFLGIDHTAIGIANTAASLEILSRPAGDAESGRERKFRNRTGTSQSGFRRASADHCDACEQRTRDRVSRIPHAARWAADPGRNEGERPCPLANHDRDQRLGRNGAKAQQNHVGFVSSDVTIVPKDKARFSRGVLVSDPDGHDVLLVEVVAGIGDPGRSVVFQAKPLVACEVPLRPAADRDDRSEPPAATTPEYSRAQSEARAPSRRARRQTSSTARHRPDR